MDRSRLPDDVWLMIFGLVDTARDLSHLSRAHRRLHGLVEQEGWRIFVRTRFDSLDVSKAVHRLSTWTKVADSLTWQSKQWDRRSLHFSLLRQPEIRNQGGGRGRGGRIAYQTTVAAKFTASGDEIAVFGKGEDLMARRRQRRADGRSVVVQSELLGWKIGFRSGVDDIKALALIEHPNGDVAFLEGRDSGSLTLRSAQAHDFGSVISSLDPRYASEPSSRSHVAAITSKPAQETINTLDITLEGTNLSHVAATTNDGILFYSLEGVPNRSLAPVAYYDLNSHAQLRAAKWMGSTDTLAIAVKSEFTEPTLRYLSVTSTGFTDSFAAKMSNLEHHFSSGEGKVCEYSLTPVKTSAGQVGTNLLLSAWRDGTCRLQDLRTPSVFDQTYQDLINPYDRLEVLMTYGTERFVGGGLDGTTIKVFDLRWPKQYHYTATLPCTPDNPYPAPSQSRQSPPGLSTLPRAQRRAVCDWTHNQRCSWHELSRRVYYRPNADIFLAKSLQTRKGGRGGIWSLAKPADYAPHFYVGISGGIIEARLQSDTPGTLNDPHMGFGDDPYHQNLEPALMEAGDGSLYQRDQVTRIPRMRGTVAGSYRNLSGVSSDISASHHRLDRRFQLVGDDGDRF